MVVVSPRFDEADFVFLSTPWSFVVRGRYLHTKPCGFWADTPADGSCDSVSLKCRVLQFKAQGCTNCLLMRLSTFGKQYRRQITSNSGFCTKPDLCQMFCYHSSPFLLAYLPKQRIVSAQLCKCGFLTLWMKSVSSEITRFDTAIPLFASRTEKEMCSWETTWRYFLLDKVFSHA